MEVVNWISRWKKYGIRAKPKINPNIVFVQNEGGNALSNS